MPATLPIGIFVAYTSPNGDHGGLSPRELEVVALVVAGKSNREIAYEMTVGVKTIETYMTRIFNKLALDSRTQVAVWAVESRIVEVRHPQL